MNVGRAIRHFRQEAGLTQEQLAHQAGLTLATVNAIENNPNAKPSWQTVVLLADALGVPLDDLRKGAAA